MFDCVIIGGGPIGMYGYYLANLKGLKACLIEKTKILGGQPINLYAQKSIYDFPLFKKITAKDFINHLNEQVNNYPDNVLTNCEIKKIELNKNVYKIVTNKSTITTKTIIFTIGNGVFTPNKLECSGAEKIEIDYNVQDLNKYKNKNVIILGGGDSAVDWANEIAKQKIAKSISIIHRRDQFRANGDNVKALTKNKVDIYLNAQVVSVDKNKIVINQENKNKIINANAFIVQYGQTIVYDDSLTINGLKYNKDHKLTVNVFQQTNLNNVYACGNICTYKNKPFSLIGGMGEIAVAINSIINTVKEY